MSGRKSHVRKGDRVTVIAGNHKGLSGTVLEVFREKGRVLVEGVHMIKKHQKKTPKSPEGGIIEREAPVHISNVKLVQPAESKTRAKKSPAKKKKA